jgi:hypothetical protein
VPSMNIARSIALLSAIAFLIPGCGEPEGPKMVTVSGHVTFDGRPVNEGTVMFLHTATQDAQQAVLGPDGEFEISVREGQHKVAVEPIVIETPASATSPGNSDYKKVANIPGRYRSAETSGFTADVKEPAEFDFDMKPGGKAK